jgi:alpha-ribazole phosphatase
MKLTLIRHTSVDVPKGICYGKTDVRVSPTYCNEMQQVKKELENKKFDAIFSSPLQRCTKLTSDIFPEANIRIDTRLTELDFGAWEMVSWDTIYQTRKGKEWFGDYVNTPCFKGESFSGLIKRCESFLTFLRESNLQDIAVFTHSGVIRALLSINQDITPEDTFYVPIAYGQIIDLNFNQ